MESAKKVGIEGAAEFLEDPNNGLKEVSFFKLLYVLVFFNAPFGCLVAQVFKT